MNLKTLKYEKIEQKLAKGTNVPLGVVEASIRVAVYMAMVEGNDTLKKFEMIESAIVNYFKLDELLNDKEVDAVFELVVGDKQKEEELLSLTIKEIQSLYLLFIISVEEDDLKHMLYELMNDISMINGEASTSESLVKLTYTDLQNSQYNYDAYQPILKKVDEYRSNSIYARQAKHTSGFYKKLKKALATYGYGLIEDDVIALYDSTIFGGADEGFLITIYGILTTQDEMVSVIPFASIYKVTYDNDAMKFFYKVEEDEEPIEIASLPRIDNLRILATILQQIADVNIALDEKEEVAS